MKQIAHRGLFLAIVFGLILGILGTAFPLAITNDQGPLRLVIGNQVSAQEADYTCDGTDDDVQFQAAIDALDPGGGMLYVLAGQYTFSDTVTRTIDSVSIIGLGGSTTFTYDNSTPLFSAGGNKWIFSNLWTDAGGLEMGETNDWCWLNIGIYETLYPVYTTEGGTQSMELHGNEWHTTALATQASVTTLNATLNDALADIALLQADLSTLNSTVQALDTDVADLQTDLATLNSTVVQVISDLNDLEGTVTTLNSTLTGLSSTFTTLNSTVTTHTSTLATLNTTVTNQATIAIVYIIDGGGSAITTGIKGFLEIPFACTVKNWTALANAAGAIQVDVWKDTYANFPPTDADSISSGKEVIIAATNQKAQDTDITDWTTTMVAAGDTLAFNVDSCATITRVTITITATRS